MDLITARTEVRQRLGEDEEDFWSDAYLTGRLNEAVRRFSNEELWPWLITEATANVLAGVEALALEPDVAPNRYFSLRFTMPGQLEPQIPRKVAATEGFTLAAIYRQAGRPMYIYLVSGAAQAGATGKYVYQVRFLPTPNQDLAVAYQYARIPAVAVGDADLLDVPEMYAEGVVAWAAGTAWLRELRERQKAEEQFQVYQAVLSQARRDSQSQAPDEPLVVGGREPQWRRNQFNPWGQIDLPLGP